MQDDQGNAYFGNMDRSFFNIVKWFAALLVVVQCKTLTAQDGVPDLEYGTAGLAQTYICSLCNAYPGNLEYDPQGRVVMAGSVREGSLTSGVFAVRYTLEGEVDSTFGTNGRWRGVFCTSDDVVSDMAIAPDASIYISGREDFGISPLPPHDRAAILHLNPDGELDTDWGVNGVFTMHLDNSDHTASTIAVQPDGKVVAGGYYSGGAFLFRLNTDATYDTTFGTNGLVMIPTYSTTREVALQPDGKILAVVASYTPLTSQLLRFMPDGSVDTDFAFNGVYTISESSPGWDFQTGIYLLPDGRITCVVYRAGPDNAHRIIRILPDGTGDPTFGTQGVVDISSSEVYGENGNCMLTDGRVLLSRITFNLQAIKCVNNDGTIDEDFGVNGLVYPIAPATRTFNGMAVGPDQRFAVSSWSPSDHPLAQQDDVAAMMYKADSLWSMTVGVTEYQQPVLHVQPTLYSGGPLVVRTPLDMADCAIRVYGPQGQLIQSGRLGTLSAGAVTDISHMLPSLSSGVYTFTLLSTFGGHLSTRVMVVH